jgi:hypothetical protein
VKDEATAIKFAQWWLSKNLRVLTLLTPQGYLRSSVGGARKNT